MRGSPVMKRPLDILVCIDSGECFFIAFLNMCTALSTCPFDEGWYGAVLI